MGSWKTIAIFGPLTLCICFSLSFTISCPSKRISPSLMMVFDTGLRRMMLLAVTDFPDPDSPTMARVSPRLRSNVTPRTAWTSPA
jgi:hypothetical protein